MKKEIYVSLLIISICIFIIAAGCGGGNDGITQSGAISDGTGYGSLDIRVVWPQSGIEGSYLFSSGEDNTLTASMPYNITRIEFEIYEANIEPPNLLGSRSLTRPVDEPESKVTIDRLPATLVLIKATLYRSNGE